MFFFKRFKATFRVLLNVLIINQQFTNIRKKNTGI